MCICVLLISTKRCPPTGGVWYWFFTTCCKPGDWVLIPCCGAGSEVISALIAGLNVVAFDIRPSQVKGTQARVMAMAGQMSDIDPRCWDPLDGTFFNPINRMTPKAKTHVNDGEQSCDANKCQSDEDAEKLQDALWLDTEEDEKQVNMDSFAKTVSTTATATQATRRSRQAKMKAT